MKRRSFLKTVAATAGAGAVAQSAYGRETKTSADTDVGVDGMPRRILGRTGERVSIIGYPGFALRKGTQEEGTASLRNALENGVNYFDVAPAYANGVCEEKMGIGLAAIKECKRDSIFLACKTKMRDAKDAQVELDRSLKRLKTDHFDLYQLHCLIKPDDDVEAAFAPGGVMETVFKAQKEGKIRFIGFSAHTSKAALAALGKFHFDTVMFPINFIEMFTFGFGKKVLDLAAEQGAGVLAIKTISGGDWPAEFKGKNRKPRPRDWWYRTLEKQADIDLAVRYTVSQKAVVAGIPPAWLDLAAKTIDAGRRYRPITDADTEKLRQMASTRLSVFQSRQQVARQDWHDMHRFDGPHEECPCMIG